MQHETSSAMDTKMLFHEDPYRTEAHAWIDDFGRDEKNAPYIVLSETLFYPQGGGQKGDRGLLQVTDANGRALDIPIIDTKKAGGTIRHMLGGDEQCYNLLAGLVGTSQVRQVLDWPFRYHQMRIHSTAHLIHCMLERVVGHPIAHPTRSPLSERDGENQYEFVGEFSPTDLTAATELLNDFTRTSHQITTAADPSRGSGFRWWRCEEWEIPCGGVHPRDAEELGRITTEMTEKKGKTRVVFRFVQ